MAAHEYDDKFYIHMSLPRVRMRSKGLCDQSGVHKAKAEECTTPRIGSRNIEIKIGGGGLPRNQK